MRPSAGMKTITIAAVLVVAAFTLLGLASCGADQAPNGGPKTQQTGPAASSTTAPPTTGSSGTTAPPTSGPAGEPSFTPDELAGFDGTNGNPAYVAVDGMVYDVSASTEWVEGRHTDCNLGAMAGQDLSELIKRAPASMRGLLDKMPVVGTLAQP